VFRNSLPGWKDLVILERSKTATTTQDAVDTVAEVEGAIGFGPFSRELEKRVAVLRLDGVHPTSRAYPSGIDLLLIHREATLTPEGRRFLDFVASREAHDAIVRSGAVPLQALKDTTVATGS
jgi:phosphate transport system substrate-binding protein